MLQINVVFCSNSDNIRTYGPKDTICPDGVVHHEHMCQDNCGATYCSNQCRMADREAGHPSAACIHTGAPQVHRMLVDGLVKGRNSVQQQPLPQMANMGEL